MNEQEFTDKLRNLEQTKDANARNQLAMDLSETKDPRVFEALIRLIGRSGLENHRGTLVYCLEQYDCSSVVDLLRSLAETGNFEVAAHAQIILDEQGLG